MFGECEQRLLWHGVDRVRGRQTANIKHIRCLRILRAGAGAEQSSRPCAPALKTLPSLRVQQVAIRLLGLLRHRPPKPIPKFGGRLVQGALSQRLTNTEATERTSGPRLAAIRRSRPRK